MTVTQTAAAISAGETALGIELGSTRIKAVLIGPDFSPIASGAFDWENSLAGGVWTYRLEDAVSGIQSAYRELSLSVKEQYGAELRTLGALGISAMMHGYLPLDENGAALTEFRTWRNTITEEEAGLLTQRFSFNIPQRWSIAHLYRAIRLREPHIPRLAHLTTLAGYIHWRLTGRHVLGVGEAAGMFPIDSETCSFDRGMEESFDRLLSDEAVPWRLSDILPQVLPAGANAGALTEEGARLLDPTGTLQPGIPLCPPEGDAGTGMVATNSVAPRTGNVSAGTSIFAMVVLEKPLSRVYPKLDMVTTPAGAPVAMVHCNTCTSDLDAWVSLFAQLLERTGTKLTKPRLYDMLYNEALSGAPDCGGVTAYNCYSGEPVIGLREGRPLLARQPEIPLTLGDFMRAQLFAAMAPLKLGMDLLLEQEHAALDCLTGHGGLFKTPEVGQRLMAGALGVPVSVMSTAGEGGPWGMAVLAMYSMNGGGMDLPGYLEQKVFAGAKGSTSAPDPVDTEGFAGFLKRYKALLPAEQLAGETKL